MPPRAPRFTARITRGAPFFTQFCGASRAVRSLTVRPDEKSDAVGRGNPQQFRSIAVHAFFNNQFAGSLTRRVGRYIDGFDSLWRETIYSLLPTTFFILGATTILYSRNHILGIILILWLIVFLIFNFTTLKLRQPLRVSRAEAESKTAGILADIVSNQNTIVLFSGVSHE